MTCKARSSQFIFALAFMFMWNMDSQKDCTVPINRWVAVMWLLMTSKYLTLEDDVRENPIRLFCGSNLINPVMFYWIIKGIFYLKWAEGRSCFIGTSFSMIVFQMIVALTSILIFVVGMALLALACLSKILYVLVKLFLGEERANRLPLFRVFRIFVNHRGVPSLNENQIDQLKAKIGQVMTEENAVTPDFTENPCSICWCNLESGQEYIKLRCRHHYHTECLSLWLQKKSTCPLCSGEIKVSDYENGMPAQIPTQAQPGGTVITLPDDSVPTNLEMSAAGIHDGPLTHDPKAGHDFELTGSITTSQSIELSEMQDNSTVGLTANEG